MNSAIDFTISSLGHCRIPSPIHLSRSAGDYMADYVSDDDRIIYNVQVPAGATSMALNRQELLERAGPREKIYFDPARVNAAIMTCGGLCPGLNDVIRAVVMCLWFRYGVRRITGIRNGYRGLLPGSGLLPIELSPELVAGIHNQGGTILGSSRGGGDQTPDIADAVEQMNLNMLFVIGGDGSQKGALALAQEAQRRGLKLTVVGVPKTIDNDLCFVERSFGFDTAVSEAVKAVAAAHVEAHDAINGIGLVKVMGRDSGFIAAHTALAMNDVNYVLIPEVPFKLMGPNGLLEHLKQRLERRRHAVILVAEGAGQELLKREDGVDASGNRKLGDIGPFLRESIKAFFASEGMEINLKYIDPSYMIRSAPAIPSDSLYCTRLGAHAVHAAMAGKTQVLVSQLNNHFVHVPLQLVVAKRNRVDPEGSLWRDVVDTTGQPPLMQ